MNVIIETKSAEREFLPARRVWERYAVCSMTLNRWVQSETLNFPQPTYFGRLRFWRLADLEAWERQQAAKIREAA